MADKALSPDQVIASLLQGKSRREMMVILARLEHGGAGIYQSFAANERNEKARAAFVADYREKFANPYKAAELGFIDEVIYPRTLRARLHRSLEMLKDKRDSNPPKKHSNIPL